MVARSRWGSAGSSDCLLDDSSNSRSDMTLFPASRTRRSGPGLAALMALVLGLAACDPASGEGASGENRAEAEAPSSATSDFEPAALYLTWTDDPTTTMTVQWQHRWEDGYRDPALGWREPGASEWTWVVGHWDPFPFSDRIINTVTVEGLEPDARYEFRLGRLEQEGPSPEDRSTDGFRFVPDGPLSCFRTLPRSAEGLRYAVGGDLYGDPEVYRAMNRTLASEGVRFALIGGDLAYANGRPDRIEKWYDFFRIWEEEMVTEEGCPIPIVVGMGNHEAHGDTYEDRGRGTVNRSPYFPRLFAFPGPDMYGLLDLTDDLTVLMLDSHHAEPVHGAQLEWLDAQLELRANSGREIIPVYHVPAYPSVRDFEGDISTRIREHWLPRFEAAGVRVAFENHDHAYKRTPPIRGGEVHDDGIVFIGDGAWGVGVRDVHDASATWYLERAESLHHALVVESVGGVLEVRAVGPDGQTFDEVRIP
ncbi:MAG: metallophosphoesterase family protein [Gemmatimonadales bacterium]|nr:MAG: metallophosphoesterase family protein [Gemmatimonadales bacterium]